MRQAACHELDHRQADQRDRGSGEVLEVAGETAAARQPRKRSLYDPALWQYDEAARALGAADDAQPPSAAASRRGGGTRTLVPGIGEDCAEKGEQRSSAAIQ